MNPTFGNNPTFTAPQAPTPQAPQQMSNSNRNWALVQALGQNSGGGWAGMIPQLVGAYAMKQGKL